ncbi:MAG: HoxN/HupN/NixA family nickel/cobalt transporter [Steroidobacteraceae bacterium]
MECVRRVRVRRPVSAQTPKRRRVVRLGALLLAWNALAWLWAALAFRHQPLLIGTALLAYGFGLRHAVDADHIAAIDNVTRKLLQQNRPPLTAGLYFSLGHSTVVTAMTVLVVLAAEGVRAHFPHLRAVGGVIGTAVSALFLLAIAAANLAILLATWRGFRAARAGEFSTGALLAAPGGLLARLWSGTFRLVERSAQMYWVGLLFGLGFDTATEIGLLGVSAAGAAQGLSVWSILVLPAVFSAGMALVDTADSVVMAGAYGWAFLKPIRKLYYNLTVTSLSVLVALLVAGIEVLGLLGQWLRPYGEFWRGIAAINGHFAALGYGIVGLFVLGWLVSLTIYKLAGYETA